MINFFANSGINSTFLADSRSDGEMNNMRETNEARSNPAQHLYLWALLFNRIHMSQVFWKYIPDNLGKEIGNGIVGALVAR